VTARATGRRAAALGAGLCLAALAAAEPPVPDAAEADDPAAAAATGPEELGLALPPLRVAASAPMPHRRARAGALGAPLDGPLVVSSPFDPNRLHPILGERLPHLGVDLAAPAGATVRAVAAGVVVAAERREREGNLVAIRHAGGLESQYWHLLDLDRGVRAGAHLRRGQAVGRVGSTGLSTGPHLHFALLRDGVAVDPLPALSVTAQPGDER
jgi:murein DD-endopeptidase MepM/ murein hydrolase activator NlpD